MAMKGGNPKNLRNWKPGQSGNPSGRPKSVIAGHITALTGRRLTKSELQLFKKMKIDIPATATFGEAMAIALFRHAFSGKIDAAREIGDRVDGKVRAQVEVTGEAGGPLQVEVVFVDD